MFIANNSPLGLATDTRPVCVGASSTDKATCVASTLSRFSDVRI